MEESARSITASEPKMALFHSALLISVWGEVTALPTLHTI